MLEAVPDRIDIAFEAMMIAEHFPAWNITTENLGRCFTELTDGILSIYDDMTPSAAIGWTSSSG